MGHNEFTEISGRKFKRPLKIQDSEFGHGA